MCLHELLTKKEKNEIIDKIGKKGMKVYKIIENRKNMKFGPFMFMRYCKGINKIMDIEKFKKIYSFNPLTGKNITYKQGLHFYKTRKAANTICEIYNERRADDSPYPYEVVECIVKKSWIIGIGKEMRASIFSFDDPNNPAVFDVIIVSKKAIFS